MQNEEKHEKKINIKIKSKSFFASKNESMICRLNITKKEDIFHNNDLCIPPFVGKRGRIIYTADPLTIQGYEL